MKQLQDALKNGKAGYTPATMWFTSGNINKKEMTRQIEGFHKQGIQDFFIHPSDGTQGDYLGEYFFSMIRHAAAEAKRLGMHYWIYDEYNWPSGTAGGQVLLAEPWTKGSCLSREIRAAAPGETVTVVLPPKETHNTQIAMVWAGGSELEFDPEITTVTWTNTGAEDSQLEVYYISWMIRKVECLLGAEVVDPAAMGYLDMMDPEAVQVFIRMTHEAYKREIGEGFGDYVKGVFTDEVSITPQLFGETRPEYPWTRYFREKFQERNGYDIWPRVKDLMDLTDVKLTVDYWETVSELFMRAYMDLTLKWCEENGLIYTGHLLIEERMEAMVIRSGDPYEYYKRFTWPGIDTICTYYCIDDYNYNLPGKRCASAAQFLNKERVLSETFTCSGWDIRLRDMKRVFNRLAVLGVDFIQYMGSRYDFMPAPNYIAMTNNWQNPLFRHYEGMSRYISGVQWLVANTRTVSGTMLLFPLTTGRATLPPLPKGLCLDGELNRTMDGLVNALLNLQVPYEIGFEQVIDQAEIADGELRFNGQAFHTNNLPSTLYLKEKTYLQLQRFAKSGGRIIQVNGTLETVIGETAYAAPALENAVSYDCREYEILHKFRDKKGAMGAFTEALRQALGEDAALPVRLAAHDDLLSVLRKKDDDYYVLMANDRNGEIQVTGEVLSDLPFCAIDTETGAQHPMTVEGKQFSLALCPYQSVVLVLSKEAVASPAPVCAAGRRTLPLANTTFSLTDLNTAQPEMWQVRGKTAEAIIRAQRVYNSKRVCDLAAQVPEEDLMRCRTKGNIYVKTEEEIDWYGCYPTDGQKPAPGSTQVCVYDFVLEELPPYLELASDIQFGTLWFLNGEQLYPTAIKRLWHYSNPVYDLEGVAKPGKNRLVSVCTLPDYERGFTLPCALLRGDFRLFEDRVLTQKPGGNALTFWNGQGYFCYTGDGVYTAEFTAPESGRVFLDLATTDAAEVKVNDIFAGKRIWDPYRLELTEFLQPGVNKLEIRVTSTLSSFVYNLNPSGVKAVELVVEE